MGLTRRMVLSPRPWVTGGPQLGSFFLFLLGISRLSAELTAGAVKTLGPAFGAEQGLACVPASLTMTPEAIETPGCWEQVLSPTASSPPPPPRTPHLSKLLTDGGSLATLLAQGSLLSAGLKPSWS